MSWGLHPGRCSLFSILAARERARGAQAAPSQGRCCVLLRCSGTSGAKVEETGEPGQKKQDARPRVSKRQSLPLPALRGPFKEGGPESRGHHPINEYQEDRRPRRAIYPGKCPLPSAASQRPPRVRPEGRCLLQCWEESKGKDAAMKARHKVLPPARPSTKASTDSLESWAGVRPRRCWQETDRSR